jgi:hypothetical protein
MPYPEASEWRHKYTSEIIAGYQQFPLSFGAFEAWIMQRHLEGPEKLR